MGRKVRTTLLSVFTSVVFLACFTLHLYRLQLHGADLRQSTASALRNPSNGLRRLNFAIREDDHLRHSRRGGSSISDSQFDSILLPDWEVLLVSSPEESLRPENSTDGYDNYHCVFQNNATSPAKYVETLPSGNRAAFKCVIPISVRHLRPLLSPILTNSPGSSEPAPEMLRWSFLAYESLSTEDDVILFVKGVNNRQGVGRSPDTLSCVFFTNDVDDAVITTAVTSSTQEVFRCQHPNEPSLRRILSDGKIRVSLELLNQQRHSNPVRTVVVPSVAYYAPRPTVAESNTRLLLCACTMVHNVAKFLKEWVVFHSKLGVEKFLLYDNDSSDDLQKKVEELVINGGFNVEIVSWPWPKTQEAGFSHSVIYARDSCTWMMYLDVDEFVFSPSWLKSPQPSPQMLKSLLPKSPLSDQTAQVMIKCLEFGPSRQKSHPIDGVTQGYTCRRRSEQRHKSIVLLSAIDSSLRNVVHHFELRKGFKGRTLGVREGVVNHYKYQAWSEFKAKFRRRVSTYVVDWTREENVGSKDRTPGLGFEAVEPEGWPERFCEVRDDRLKAVAQRWFGSRSRSSNQYTMTWQDR